MRAKSGTPDTANPRGFGSQREILIDIANPLVGHDARGSCHLLGGMLCVPCLEVLPPGRRVIAPESDLGITVPAKDWTMEEPGGYVQLLMLVCFVLIPAIVALVGVVMLLRVQKFHKAAVRVTGTVVSVRTIRNLGTTNRDETSYRPTFAFDAPDGTRMQAETGSSGPAMDYPVNSTRPVWVDFSNPTVVHVSGPLLLLAALACIGIGGTMALIGMYVLGGG
jgi:hypothetical protein